MSKKLLFMVVMVIFCVSLVPVWAADFSTANGDFLSFHLRESQDTTLARFKALIQKGDIWDEETDKDGTLRFTTQIADDVFTGALYFEHKQLVQIDLIQRDGRKIAKAEKLRSYIDKKLIRAVSKAYKKPRYIREFPNLNTIGNRPYIMAEWDQWKKRVTVGIVREKNKYYAAVAIEDTEMTGHGRRHRH